MIDNNLYVDVSERSPNGRELYEILKQKEALGAMPLVHVRLVPRLPTLDSLQSRVDIVRGNQRMEYALYGTERNGGIPPLWTLGEDPARTLKETIELLFS